MDLKGITTKNSDRDKGKVFVMEYYGKSKDVFLSREAGARYGDQYFISVVIIDPIKS